MMVNKHRGEISAQLDGNQYVLCLTLGALAKLENAFGETDLNGLLKRLSSGQMSASDMLNIITAGLQGAGHTFTDDEVAEMQAEGGATGYAKIVANLLTTTFGRTTDAA